jgi:surfactin synthase thioesterase subunit
MQSVLGVNYLAWRATNKKFVGNVVAICAVDDSISNVVDSWREFILGDLQLLSIDAPHLFLYNKAHEVVNVISKVPL